jgi:Erythromycin esterase
MFRFLLILTTIATLLSRCGTTQAQSPTIPSQVIALEEDHPNFLLFDKAFYGNQLFLLGETHGFKNAQVVDLALLKHLNQRVGVRHYIAEVDPTKAYYLNQYLQTGQDSTLRLVFASWIAETAQWANQDFFRKIQAIRAYNQTLPNAKRIRFVGIDEVQDRPLIARQLIELTGNQLTKGDVPRLDSLVSLLQRMPKKPDSLAAQVALNWLAQIKNQPADYRKWRAETMTELRATLQTLTYRKTIRSREKTIFATFRDALSRYNLTNEKLYGFWGVAHVWQAPLADGRLQFAGMIRSSDLPMKGKTVSITCSYVDSFMMVPTQYLPPFWQEKGKVYSRVDKFNSNGPMMNVAGTDELIKQSQPNTTTLFKLPGTAAGKAPITATYSPFMPADQRLNFDPARPTTDYFQYIVLIRNSEMTEPF